MTKSSNTSKLRVILPYQADSDLVYLTEYLTKNVFKGEWQGGGLLGGEFGYGVDYENDTFMMHQFCWCEEDTCKWCGKNEPNFIFKPTGYKLWWYKYIGRGEESKGKLPLDWLKQCVESVTKEKDNHV